MTGKVIRKTDKGFCFVKPDNGDADHFAHMSAFKNAEWDAVKEGDPVRFDSVPNPKGPRAERIYLNDGTSSASEFDALFDE